MPEIPGRIDEERDCTFDDERVAYACDHMPEIIDCSRGDCFQCPFRAGGYGGIIVRG